VSLNVALNYLLSSVIAFSLKVHGYHWNVVGNGFQQYHALFDTIYEDVNDSIDPLAENIRKLGQFPSFTVNDVASMSRISKTDAGINPHDQIVNLLDDNAKVLSLIKDCIDVAGEEQGILNFLADRQDMHQKWGWQLRASIGTP